MKLAYFSPLGPQHSGIADYSEELLTHLKERADITLFVDGFRPASPEIVSNFTIVDFRAHPETLQRLTQFDAVIYHMGNDHRYHSGIFDAMSVHPGIVVLHDFALQEFFLGLAQERSNLDLYLGEVEVSHGQKVREEAADALRMGATPTIVSRPLEFSLNNRIVRNAEGVIVHSEWARKRISEIAIGVPTAHIPMPLKFDEGYRKSAPSQQVRIASFGLVIPGKGIERTLRALSKLKDTHRFRYTLVGEPNPYFDVAELIREYEMQDLVEITGHLRLEEFKQRIFDTDIALNIRERTVGETSASLCRLMAGGVCTIVADVGWYSELPDDCVVKIELDGCADKLLIAYLERLIEDESLRNRIGENARLFAQKEHAPDRGADAYVNFIQHVIDHRLRRNVITAVSDELVQLGINSGDGAFLASVAHTVSTVVPESIKTTQYVTDERVVQSNGHNKLQPSSVSEGRTPKVEGINYKLAAKEYLGKLNEERRHHLRTKPFYNLANKPAKYRNEGMEEDQHRHFCDFANMAVMLALPAGSRILDVGCGSGWLSEYFARLGYVVKGIDISPDLIEMSRERVARVPYGADHVTPLRCSFQVHDIESSPLSEKFDAVICYDSLHHFEDDRAVMSHLAAMLDVGGVLFILEGERPAADSAGEAELRAVMDEFRTLESPFDYAYLRNLIDENGFAIVGDYVSINGLFERETIEKGILPPRAFSTGYHYLACKKVTSGRAASTVPRSNQPGKLLARFELRSTPRTEYLPSEPIELEVNISNDGDTLWLAGTEPNPGVVMPAIRLFDEAGVLIRELHGEPALPRPVAPGETFNLRIALNAPNHKSSFVLKLDLVAEHICWFERHGSSPLTVNFKVV